jgi:hypothetical protein
MEKITLTLTRSQVRDAAMREQGIDPVRLALKPGIRVEKNRKHAAKLGQAKHKKELCFAD